MAVSSDVLDGIGNYASAVSACATLGGRLCTAQEVFAGNAKNSACGMDTKGEHTLDLKAYHLLCVDCSLTGS